MQAYAEKGKQQICTDSIGLCSVAAIGRTAILHHDGVLCGDPSPFVGTGRLFATVDKYSITWV